MSLVAVFAAIGTILGVLAFAVCFSWIFFKCFKENEEKSSSNQTAYVTKIINKAQIESSLDQQTISTQSRSVEASFHQENTQIAKSLNEQTLGSQQLSSNEVVRDEASGQAEKIETEIVETLLDIFLEGVSIIIDVMDDDD